MKGHNFGRFAEKMRLAGMRDLQIESFRRHYAMLIQGWCCTLSHSAIGSVEYLPRLEHLVAPRAKPLADDSTPACAWAGRKLGPEERQVLKHVAVLKLNGGLGTSMGLSGPKSLLPARDDYTFLDVLMRQVGLLRQAYHVELPLILMNSFATHQKTMEVMKYYANITKQCVPVELLQSQVPKILAEDYSPVHWPDSPELEWCPPGHGDVYLSLYISGILDKLLKHGFRHLFMSNIDNLGATVDVRIPQWMLANQVPFVMEVAERCESDRKGGHLARYSSGDLKGHLVLREVAMCPKEEAEEFQDIEKYRFFNTNSLWLDLQAWRSLLETNRGLVDLPLIINRKPVDPLKLDSPQVIQLESAMGAAISSFSTSVAVIVPRERFAPVKNLCDLLALRSDAYEMSPDYSIRLVEQRSKPPIIELDRLFCPNIQAFKDCFPGGTPSLIDCDSLKISGPVTFGRNVRCEGHVRLAFKRPYHVPDNTVLSNCSLS